ncbi:MAG: type II toxin-antitoxin system prevent-host-death family antitoxin [Actinobacteria bacterium]|nr:type II toxin-antitoxin system prevent-host-death family antitoxin [Actinomycetota bacterium]
MSTTTGHRTISHRELRNNSGEILRAVAAGESFTITNNGQPVAELVPTAVDPFGGLTVQRADRTKNFRDLDPVEGLSGETAAESLDYLRGDR